RTLFRYPGNTETPAQFTVNFLRLDIIETEQQESMKKEVRGFIDDLLTCPRLAGYDEFSGLFSHLFQDLVDTFGHEGGGIGVFRRIGLPFQDYLVDRQEDVVI